MLFFAIAAFVLTLAQIGCIRHIRTSVRPRLTCLVYKDEVTGIFNRRYLQDRVDEEISRAVRHGRHFALIYIDLDGFKGVNDRHGHDAGDAVLRQVALCLQGNMRREDVLGRVGGDEFLVIAPDTTQENARVFAGRLRDGMSQETFKTPAGQVLESPSFTAGIACFPEDGDTRDALISKADRDMYSRKRPATPRG
jgi:diguanylate cyclase (GGDEF)-like protein